MAEAQELTGRTVVITGASRGLGEAMAVGFAGAGADVVLAARSEEDLKRVAERCRAAGAPGVLTVATDVTDDVAVERLVAAAVGRFGGIDTFVSNAGVSAASLGGRGMTTLDTYTPEVARRIVEVNLIGAGFCLHAALPRMGAGSSFTAVGSGPGMNRPGGGWLAVSKAGLAALVAIAAAENRERGVRVNVLHPGGMVDTALFGPGGLPEAVKQRMHVAEPDVIVPAALWLASEAAADITGQTVSACEFNTLGAAAFALTLREH